MIRHNKTDFQHQASVFGPKSNHWRSEFLEQQLEIAVSASIKPTLTIKEKVAICVSMGLPCEFIPIGLHSYLINVVTPKVSFVRDGNKWHIYYKAEVPTEYDGVICKTIGLRKVQEILPDHSPLP